MSHISDPIARYALVLAAAALGAVVASGTAAAADDEARAAQASIDCTKVIPIVPNQFPAWGEAGGWDEPSQYTTIQVGDIDGDGRAELVGRSHAGLVTSEFDPDTGVWKQVDATTAFSDGFGWSHPSLYGTMQLADIDGKPGMELVSRGQSGFFTLRWNGNGWTTLSEQAGLMVDAGGWANPSGYSTIQLGDVDGEPGAELVGRRPGSDGGGVYTYKWSGSSWQQIGFSTAFGDQYGWDVPENYETFQLANIDGQPGEEILSRGHGGMYTATWTARGWDVAPVWHAFADDEYGNRPDVYLTLQTADVDGNGRAELIGRVPGQPELGVWEWASDGWRSHSQIAGFGDDSGWDQPEYYRTIQTANLDGKRGAEILYRTSAGLNAAKYDPSAKTWSRLTSGPVSELSDAEGFNLPQSYTTIQAGNVVGDARQEIVARAAEGIETFNAATAAATSFESTLEPGFPDLTDDPDELAAYRWVGQNAFVRASTNDVRSQYANQLWKDRWVDAARQLQTMLSDGTTPRSLDPAAFRTVATQLETEFAYVDDLNVWSAQVDGLFTQIFVNKIFDTIRVPQLMNLPVAGNDTETVLEILSLVASFVENIAGLAGGEGKLAGEVVGMVAGLVETSMDAAVAASGEPPSIDSTVAELDADLQIESTRAQNANGCIQEAFAQNWALLKALGEPIDTGAVAWDSTQTPAMAAAAQRGYELVLWQTLTPIKWKALDGTDVSHLAGCNYINSPPNPYPADQSGNAYWYELPQGSGAMPLAFLIQDGCSAAPPREALGEVLDRPNADGTGALGVLKLDVLCGVDGWRVPNSGVVNQACPPPWGTGLADGPVRAAALAQIRALRSTVRAQAKTRRARRALVGTVGQAEVFARRARRTGIQSYADMAENALRVYIRRLDVHAGDGLARKAARRHAERAFALRGMLAGLPGGRPPRARVARAPVAVDASGRAAIRVRCPRGAVRLCSGVLRLLHGKRVIARQRFAVRPGQARRVKLRLSNSARRRLARRERIRAKARATTAHPSGKRANSARRIVLKGRS